MKIFTGRVISVKMKNTATVSVDSTSMHRLYGKRFTRSKKYHVHDDYGVIVGDVVNFVASKPYSKMKKWKIIKVDDKKAVTKRALKKTEGTETKATQKAQSKRKLQRKGKKV